MADTQRAAFSLRECRPISFISKIFHLDATLMAFELLFLAQMIRRPAQALARRWYCRSLVRASRGRFHCAGCTKP